MVPGNTVVTFEISEVLHLEPVLATKQTNEGSFVFEQNVLANLPSRSGAKVKSVPQEAKAKIGVNLFFNLEPAANLNLLEEPLPMAVNKSLITFTSVIELVPKKGTNNLRVLVTKMPCSTNQAENPAVLDKFGGAMPNSIPKENNALFF